MHVFCNALAVDRMFCIVYTVFQKTSPYYFWMSYTKLMEKWLLLKHGVLYCNQSGLMATIYTDKVYLQI